jgi:phosphoglycolate phosphatase-like HAD superfamily hydrolase
MRERPLLILDFDGVICDSLDECFVSSWRAYHTLYRNAELPHVAVSLRDDFSRLRPFIRAGEDYVLIQEILHLGKNAEDQTAFDALIHEAGPLKMKLFKELFTRARTELFAKDREFWLSLNRIYPHMQGIFAKLPQQTPLAILSTKMPFFIAEILGHAQIRVPQKNIHECKAEEKLSRAEELRASGGFPRAVFIDDQIDYLKNNTNPCIDVFLASWGYVKPEWLAGSGNVPIMTPADLAKFVEKEYTAEEGS